MALPNVVEEMAAHYVAALRTARPDGPYVLIGYSMGGSVAYEMARQLRAAGADVSGLALLDTWRPDGHPAPQQSRAELIGMLAEDIGLPPPASPWESVAEFYQAASDAGILTPGYTLEQAEQVIAVWTNNARIVRDYVPPPGLDVPILQVRALRRDIPLSDWSALAGAAITSVDLDCTHRGLIQDEHASDLADAVVGHLLQRSQ